MSSASGDIIEQNGSADITPPPSDSFKVGSATYELVNESVTYLMKATKLRPKIGLICGTGLGILTDNMTDKEIFPYKDIPNFPISTAKGHKGNLVFGLLDNVPLMVLEGRFHVYEGYPLWMCGMPVRVMKLFGIQTLISTNAAGGLNPEYKKGDIMFLKDHVNMQGFAGDSPLKGKNDERFGPRFPAMSNAYDQKLITAAHKYAAELNMKEITKEGIYVMCCGPTYETVAELLFLRRIGVDAVGMSTVPEVLVARHCDLKVFAFSLITNICIVDYETDEETEVDVCMVAKTRENELKNILTKMVTHISQNES